MDSLLMTNSLNVSNDPFSMSLSSFDPTTTFLDSFAPPAWPWTIGGKLEPTWEEPPAPQPLALSQAQCDAFKFDLASPVPTPRDFVFEIEPDTTKYETCYDELMEIKLAVLQELLDRVKARPVEEPLPPVPAPEDPTPLVSLESFFEGAFTMPDPLMDNFWLDMASSAINAASPSTSTSASSSSSISTPSTSASSCPTPSAETTASWLDIWDPDLESASADDNPKDGDYLPFQFQDQSPSVRRKTVRKQPQQHAGPFTAKAYFAEPLPDVPAQLPKAKPKRKTLPSQTQLRDAKRLKVDPEVVCRINGCRHISKTRFECFKHRETHFPGRFQCPHPACRKIFVRSSSLSRHLKRPRNAACGAYAGSQAEWGVGLIRFELHPPAWITPGFLDDISEL
ncbi:hypothetical protein LshimejAT787_1802160 [Lyophyllum shimeji]|uniref:C2H2-type domain-containing protein n=1 Tax=Lyophyllum shimeji TaxID=47721 RepID=A0A9P3Q0K0_LYOSH|nr:hypothetical protein LshimejAT787_1802160 [Lyophyllum shimeji]